MGAVYGKVPYRQSGFTELANLSGQRSWDLPPPTVADVDAGLNTEDHSLLERGFSDGRQRGHFDREPADGVAGVMRERPTGEALRDRAVSIALAQESFAGRGTVPQRIQDLV
jgi:hypothetical protein